MDTLPFRRFFDPLAGFKSFMKNLLFILFQCFSFAAGNYPVFVREASSLDTHGLSFSRQDAAPTTCRSHNLPLPQHAGPTTCRSHNLPVPQLAAPTTCRSHAHVFSPAETGKNGGMRPLFFLFLSSLSHIGPTCDCRRPGAPRRRSGCPCYPRPARRPRAPYASGRR